MTPDNVENRVLANEEHAPKLDYYLRFPAAEVERKLHNRRMLPKDRAKLIALIEAKRANIKSETGKRIQLRKLWGELMAPAKRELHVCSLIIKETQRQLNSGYRSDGEEKLHALREYCKLIEALIGKAIEWERLVLITPGQQAKKSTRAFPNGVPNGGIHWTDWINHSRKTPIRELFDAIPKRSGIKCKTPFERKIPRITVYANGLESTLFEEQRLRLLERTIKELEGARNNEAVNPTEAGGERVNKMREAIAWLQNCEEGEPIPPTWHGIFKAHQ